MALNIKEQLQEAVAKSIKNFFPLSQARLSIELEIPRDKSHGEYSTNVALKSAKLLKRSPLVLAEKFKQTIEKNLEAYSLKKYLDKVEIQEPGFINFFLSQEAVYNILKTVIEEKETYGKSNVGKAKKVQIEFVSANPTGPLSVAHARQAAVGDALANVLNFLGFETTKEFYVNDEGNQINLLGRSIQHRAKEILGETGEFPKEGYQGEYIRDIAAKFLQDRQIKDVHQFNSQPLESFSQYGVDYLLKVIQEELEDFGVHFDVWSFQSQIATQDKIEEMLAYLGEKGFLYEKEGALWFKTTDFEDDKDRVVEKSDGTCTYFTPDIVYHKNKFDRGFEWVINIWGPDHHGYIPRMKAAVEALGKDREALRILIVQLATIYRDGKPLSMSTRRGQYISLREVMEEVGVDVSRFFFLMRHIHGHLDFDLELAKKESPENPVYYIQYAHARIYSIFEKAKEAHLTLKTSDFQLLKKDEEIDLIKKLGNFSDIIQTCYQQLDPYTLVDYMLGLATAFHKFYDQYRVIDINEKELSSERLSLIEAVRIVLANGLRLLGVSVPQKM